MDLQSLSGLHFLPNKLAHYCVIPVNETAQLQVGNTDCDPTFSHGVSPCVKGSAVCHVRHL